MRSLRSSGSLLLSLALTWALPLSGQDRHGAGRLDGWVKDQNGQPVADATVQLSHGKGSGPSTKTDTKGYWGVRGLVGGSWNIDVSARGYETRKMTASISETDRIPPMEIQIQKVAAAAQGVEAAGKNEGAEATASVNEGNKLLGEKKFAEARAEYEKALAILPDNPALWKGIAQTYDGEGNKEKTVEALKKTVQLDPNDTDSRVLLASLLIDAGQLDEGKAALEGLPRGAVKDSAVYVNIAIIFMNKNKPEDARAYLTKAIEMDPAQADGYYYRGMASIYMKKNADAKADFRKYLELAPNGSEAKDVREMLQTLK